MSRARRLGRTRDAVFLGYHALAEDGPEFLSMSPRTFEAQLDFLVAKGYESGTRADLDALAAGRRPPGRRAFLTFDDGFLDTFEVAAPMLAERGFTGFVFVLPRQVEDGGALAWPEVAGEVRRHPEVMRSMTWEMAGELAAAGWEIGSHTLTHPRLTGLDDAALREELAESRRLVEARLVRCDTLAYPFGAWDARVERVAAEVGYRYAFTLPIDSQAEASPLSIPRLTVDDRDSVPRFRAKVSVAGRTALFSQLRPLVRKLRRHQVHSNAE
ncbi:MAG: polysaccharide deacetylase family protein [Actinobacteria bacterium]|nr:polysaccharide deacetylase family protein [Actinomycetota bacterium]